VYKKKYISIYISPLSRIHNTSPTSAKFGLDNREFKKKRKDLVSHKELLKVTSHYDTKITNAKNHSRLIPEGVANTPPRRPRFTKIT
jgi:hypothetical protein